MKASLLLAGAAALAFGGTAIAQETMPSTATNATTPSPSTDMAPATDQAQPDAAVPDAPNAPTTAQPTTTADTSSPAPAAAGAAPAPAMATNATAPDPARLQSAQQTVQAGWATYDKENKGSLTPLEFGTWVMAAQGQDMTTQVQRTRTGRQANLPATKVLNATSAAFAKADANHDNAVSPDELSAFLAS